MARAALPAPGNAPGNAGTSSKPRSGTARPKSSRKRTNRGKSARGGAAEASDGGRLLRPSAELEEKAAALRAQAVSPAAMAESLASSIESMMVSKGLSRPRELFDLIDRDGDGKLTRAEFQKACSQMKLNDGSSGGMTSESAALDALFTSFDLDGGGDLSLSELTQALQRTLKIGTLSKKTTDGKKTTTTTISVEPGLSYVGTAKDVDVFNGRTAFRQRAEHGKGAIGSSSDVSDGGIGTAPHRMAPTAPVRLNALAAACERAAAATKAAEQAEAEVNGGSDVREPSVAQQVATIVVKRNMKVHDVVKACTVNVAWDGDTGEMRLGVAEVAAGLRSLGVHGSDADVEAFVHSLDSDSSGTVELSELKAAIKRCTAERKEANAALGVRKSRAAELLKLARREQDLLAELEAAEAKAEEAKEAARVRTQPQDVHELVR